MKKQPPPSDKKSESAAPRIVLQSTLTCPQCGHRKEETMPTDGCQFFYECENCKTVLRPKPGDCCVYCSYGSVVCPPEQEADKLGKNGFGVLNRGKF